MSVYSSRMTYVEKLEAWFEKEKANGLVDIKLFPRQPEDGPIELEAAAKALYELVTGDRESTPLDVTNL